MGGMTWPQDRPSHQKMVYAHKKSSKLGAGFCMPAFSSMSVHTGCNCFHVSRRLFSSTLQGTSRAPAVHSGLCRTQMWFRSIVAMQACAFLAP